MALSWATQRKLTYLSIFIAVLLIVIALPTYLVTYRAPSCTDGKQDQGEQGVDCGGPCANLCPALTPDPIIEWSRAFPVAPGFYNVVAYLDNPNIGSSAQNVHYIFQAYDAAGVQIASREGVTNITGKSTVVFESNLSTGSKVPAQVTFVFSAPIQWVKTSTQFPIMSVTDPVLSREDSSPLLQATITNTSITPIRNLPVVAIIYDTNGNAIAASQTVLSFLDKGASQLLIYTWPSPFGTAVSQKEIVPLVGRASY